MLPIVMHKKSYYLGNAIKFLQRGITLSLLILLYLSAYSNPMGENTGRKDSSLAENVLFTSFDHSFKNNPPEDPKAVRPAGCYYLLRRNTSDVLAPGYSTGHTFWFTARGNNCPWTPKSNARWIIEVVKHSTRPDETDSWEVAYSCMANPTTSARSGTITLAPGYEYTVRQSAAAVACTYELSSSTGTATATAGTGSVTVTTNRSDCPWAWEVSSDKGWLTITNGKNKAGSGTLNYSYTANPGTTAREGRITVGEKTYTVRQAGAACSISLPSTTTANVPPTAGKGSVEVTANFPECTWTPVISTDAASWLFITGNQGSRTGTQTLHYSYTPNPDIESRTGTITVGEQTYTVTQEAADVSPVFCSGSVSPTGARIGAEASSGKFSVILSSETCTWKTFTPDDWITRIVQDTKMADGAWNFTYYYTANTSTSDRVGRIFVDNLVYTVTQAGSTADCSYTLSSNMGSAGSGAGSGSVRVSTNLTDCTWTAAVAQGVSWITITPGQTLTGSKAVNYTYTENTNAAPRTGNITVAGHTYTLTQAGTATASCSYSLSAAKANIGAAASTAATKGIFLVIVQGTNCAWAATTTSDWITGLTKSATANAEEAAWITYSWLANTSTAERTGTITVGDKTYTVKQAGAACRVYLQDNEVTVLVAAGEKTFLVDADADCEWTPTVTQGADWITIKAAAGQTFRGKQNLTYSYAANPNAAPRTGIISVSGREYSIVQSAAECSISLREDKADVPVTAGVGTIPLVANGVNCEWTAIVAQNATWITINNGQQQASNSGTRDLSYSYQANPNADSREGIITVSWANGTKTTTYTVKQAGTGAASSCSYTLTPAEVEIGAEASTAETKGSFSVAVQGTNCTWTPEPTKIWINNLTKAANADGSWTVTYTYMANTSAVERTGAIKVGDKTYTVKQAGGATCSITLPKNTGSVSSQEGSGAFSVLSNGDACEWTAVVAQEDAGWLSIDVGGQVMTGIDDIYYSFTTNPNTTPREGKITVSGETYTGTYTVKQAGAGTTPCSYSLPVTTAEVSDAAGKGSVSVVVVADDSNCSWEAESKAAWITIPAGQTLVGSKNLEYSYEANTGTTPRTGEIIVAGQTFTVTQLAVVTKIEPSGGVMIFPNPAMDFVTVDLSADKMKYVSLKILNQAGQIIHQSDTPLAQVFQIPLNGLTRGMYFISFQGEEKPVVKKLIVK